MQALTNATMATTNSTIELILRISALVPLLQRRFAELVSLWARQALQQPPVPSGGTRTPRTLCSRISPKGDFLGRSHAAIGACRRTKHPQRRSTAPRMVDFGTTPKRLPIARACHRAGSAYLCDVASVQRRAFSALRIAISANISGPLPSTASSTI